MTSQSNSSAVCDLVQKGRKLSTFELKSLSFNVHGVITRVMTNSPTVIRAVASFLQAFSGDTGGDPPDIQIYLFAVDSLTDGHAPIPRDADALYDWGTLKVFHSGSLRYLKADEGARVMADLEQKMAAGFFRADPHGFDWMLTHMVFYPLWAQLMKESGLFPFHASGLVREGKGYLFPGRSGSGKSTLALRLVQKGFGLLSDDTVFLRMNDSDGVDALGFPEEVNVSRQTMELLPELSEVKNITVNDYRDKSSFCVEDLYPGCLSDRSLPVALIFPEIANAEETILETVSPTEALELSIRFGYFFLDPSTTARHLEILSRLAMQTDSYRLRCGRDQADLERVLNTILGGAPGNTARREDCEG